MPATSGRVRMPHNNRMHSSAALKMTGIWKNTIGYDPYAAEDEKKETTETSYEQAKGLMTLAKLSNKGSDVRGACKKVWKKCGKVGHLTFQCRNHLGELEKRVASSDSSSSSDFSSEEDSEDEKEKRVSSHRPSSRRRSRSCSRSPKERRCRRSESRSRGRGARRRRQERSPSRSRSRSSSVDSDKANGKRRHSEVSVSKKDKKRKRSSKTHKSSKEKDRKCRYRDSKKLHGTKKRRQ